ncbi:Uracil phosphoribosyltransferase protein [Lasiodiplodia theobromae]|uniref:Uracil phosphoribosyltransferase protein n=1 Tax=Lasiodiplodia theobromae TaxID=45133 RepID=UPI0015C378CE|nr:Uracil phosphoribosyltransferase protein [Lasiodiplodia theobromae]KAF4537711.1 Uracil phosphoribosyltransferase protein [Lasiodiplodia theobromae]
MHASTTSTKPKVIGIYGVPGAGKTFLFNQLKHELGEADFYFFEGSEVIAALVPGGLVAFKQLDDQEKTKWREEAIYSIENVCRATRKTGIVTGHFMFWREGEEEGEMVYTPSDLKTYTHIVYLDVPADVVEQRRRDDTERSRPSVTTDHLMRWQQAEKDRLRVLCRENSILFSVLGPHRSSVGTISALLRDFHRHTEEHNLSCAEAKLDEIMSPRKERLETVLVVDGDRTLAPVDTGALFWAQLTASQERARGSSPLKSLFSSPLGHSYDAFRQAALLCEDAVDDQEYEALCSDVASQVTMYPEFTTLLQLASRQEHIGVVVVSCGLRRVWEKVMEREGLSSTVKVIAGGRVSDGFVVSAAVKAATVNHLRKSQKLNQEQGMDEALPIFIRNHGFRAHQLLLPRNAPPRLDITTLPLITERDIIEKILCRRKVPIANFATIATNKTSAKLLATPMRNSAISGPTLQEAHRRAGAYLATEFVASIIGLEEYDTPHVMGHQSTGYRLQHEKRTTIVALMRGGEPMAMGVNDVFPLAMFVHANGPEEVNSHHVEGQSQVLLVDSVINTGESIVKFVQAIRRLHSTIRIIIVAGVVQEQFIDPNSESYEILAGDGKVNLVALRHSSNKFTGSRDTDTSNRLFNTTHLL